MPVGVLGAVAAALIFGQPNDVYFKVGILTTIGLAAKNAILIVEFARILELEGRATAAAAIEAARLRLRPILMTSLPSSSAWCLWQRQAGPGPRRRTPSGSG